MKIGLLVESDVFLDIDALVKNKSANLEVAKFTAIEQVYYALFARTNEMPQALVIQSDFGDDALERLINCVKLNFPETKIYTLYRLFNQVHKQTESEFPLSELGLRRLINLLVKQSEQDEPIFVEESGLSGRQVRASDSEERNIDNLYRKYELMLNNVGEAIIGINRHGRITFVNQFASNLFECSEPELLGSHLSDFALESPLDEGSSPDTFTASGRTQRRVGRGVIRCKNGKMSCVEYTQTYVGNVQDDTVSIMVIEDISQRVKFESKLQTLAHCDPLTGLYNRHYLKRAFNKMRKSQREQSSLGSAFYLDLDGFKRVNDQYGHAVGDKLLLAVSERLKSSCRRSDLIARLGGDEFAILSEQSDLRALESMAKHLLAKMISPYYVEELQLNISVSIGIARIENDCTSIEACLDEADKAMYEIKNNGKANYAFSQATMLDQQGA